MTSMSGVVRGAAFEDAAVYLASCVFHTIVFLILGLVLGNMSPRMRLEEAAAFDPPVEDPGVPADIAITLDPEPAVAPDDPTLSLTSIDPEPALQNGADTATEGIDGGGEPTVESAAGPGTIGIPPELIGLPTVGIGSGPKAKHGVVGVPGGHGNGDRPGGFVPVNIKRKKAGVGNTQPTINAVNASLKWLARHQNPDGSWSFDHRRNCKDGTCTGIGEAQGNPAATAMALLPFLAAGHTHDSRGPYQQVVYGGLLWMVRHQKPSGDLSGGFHQMYTHGLATITLCEAYGITEDRRRLAMPAQAAVRFIETGQNAQGGWRYAHGSADSDTSVYGWQVMGLKSGLMAGLSVNPVVLEKAKRFLETVGRGKDRGQFAYDGEKPATAPMTAVGLLAAQYLGTRRDDPRMREGVSLLMANLPDVNSRNVYYWYYATQVMHNLPGPDWDTWNRRMRHLLLETQADKGCAAGSWDPERPAKDVWGSHGGRLMMTALSALSLEVYYRYLPLYKDAVPSGGKALLNVEESHAP
jgi:hypothetical protein